MSPQIVNGTRLGGYWPVGYSAVSIETREVSAAISRSRLPAVAAADDYRWEAGGNDNRFSLDDLDLDYWSLHGTYYFQLVKTDALPLQEAAYLNRASSISLAASRFESGFGDFDQSRLSSEVYIPKYGGTLLPA